MTNFNCPKCGSKDTDSLTWHSYTCYDCNTHFEPIKCDHYFPMNNKGVILPCQFCNYTKESVIQKELRGLKPDVLIKDEFEWVKVTPFEKNQKRFRKSIWKNSNDLFKSVFNKNLETTYKNNEEGC